MGGVRPCGGMAIQWERAKRLLRFVAACSQTSYYAFGGIGLGIALLFVLTVKDTHMVLESRKQVPGLPLVEAESVS